MVGAREDRADDRSARWRFGHPRVRGVDVEEDGAGQAHGPQHIRQRIHQAPPPTVLEHRPWGSQGEYSGRSATSPGRAVIRRAWLHSLATRGNVTVGRGPILQGKSNAAVHGCSPARRSAHFPIAVTKAHQAWSDDREVKYGVIISPLPGRSDGRVSVLSARRPGRDQGAGSEPPGRRATIGIIGTTLQIVGESLCEAVDLRAGSKVLDVAAGNGNCSLAAARRFCDVTSTDYVPALLEDGRRRAEAERLPIVFQEADAEALPFRDESFDVVLSSFGVMFTPNHIRAASELLRVCRRGGTHRPGQLDAARIHRAAVHGGRPPRAAAARADASFALGPGGSPRTICSARRHRTSTRPIAISCSGIVRRNTGLRCSEPGTAPCTRRSQVCRPTGSTAGAGSRSA